MAGRKDKNTVDYFPHYVNHGKTLFIIESKFGNDGYAAWFKILETLGSTEHHYIDCRKDEDWEYLNAKIKLMHTSLHEVLDLCAKLGAINKVLWENRVIYSENFVNNIADAYTRRNTDCPTLQDIVSIIGINVNINGNDDDTKPQRKEKEIREKETIQNELGKEFTEVVIEWLEYKKQRKETYKSEKSIKALCTKIKNLSEGNAAQAKAVIDQSMANNWAGLFELKNKNGIPKPKRDVPDIVKQHSTAGYDEV